MNKIVELAIFIHLLDHACIFGKSQAATATTATRTQKCGTKDSELTLYCRL